MDKWEIMETKLCESKHLDDSVTELLNELRNTKSSLDFVHKLTKIDPHVLYFKSIENLSQFIGELEDKNFFLSDILNKINEQRSLYLSFIAKEKGSINADEDTTSALELISNEINALEDSHKQASVEYVFFFKYF